MYYLKKKDSVFVYSITEPVTFEEAQNESGKYLSPLFDN